MSNKENPVCILSYGAHIPRQRIARESILDAVSWAQPALKSLGKGVRAFGNWDEDPITMAVEAGRKALAACQGVAHAGDASRAPTVLPASLAFASTTHPFSDRQNAGVIAAALDLPAPTFVVDYSGSQRAATSALVASLEARGRTRLITAAERRPVQTASRLEMAAGDAGVAIMIGPENQGAPAIARILAANSLYTDLVDHFRTPTMKSDYVYEDRWYRDEGIAKLAPATVGPLLAEAGKSLHDIAHIIPSLWQPGFASAVAGALGTDAAKIRSGLPDICGHAGAAEPLLGLCDVLDHAAPGDLILLLAFGQGCDALLLEVTEPIVDYRRYALVPPCRAIPYRIEDNYMKFLSARGDVDIDWGMRAERDNRTAQTVAYAKSRDLTGFVGGLCTVCETPQFPKSRRCVNPTCNALDTQSDYRFADRRGVIKSYTEDWLAFTRSPPYIYGNVTFEGGGNVFMEMCDFAPGDAAIGGAVEMAFRIKDMDSTRDFNRYFWKAAKAHEAAHGVQAAGGEHG